MAHRSSPAHDEEREMRISRGDAHELLYYGLIACIYLFLFYLAYRRIFFLKPALEALEDQRSIFTMPSAAAAKED